MPSMLLNMITFYLIQQHDTAGTYKGEQIVGYFHSVTTEDVRDIYCSCNRTINIMVITVKKDHGYD